MHLDQTIKIADTLYNLIKRLPEDIRTESCNRVKRLGKILNQCVRNKKQLMGSNTYIAKDQKHSRKNINISN